MTNERKTTDPGAEHDALVGETYREIAQERTPEHLDKSVLDAAARAARPRYSRLISWTRPVAWAATIMLSLALVLELTQSPVQVPADKNVTASDVAEPALKQAADAPMPQVEQSAEAAKRERPIQDAQEVRVRDTDMLERAEEMARMQQGQNDQPAQTVPEADARAPAPAALAVSSKASFDSAAALAEDLTPCDASATADPESWQRCIDELEEAGLTDIAREQRALLAEAFPDFDPH
jgi:hypothetical protein